MNEIELFKWINEIENSICKLEERILKPEAISLNLDKIIDNTLQPNIDNIHTRIDKLEKSQKELKRFQDIASLQYQKVIHHKIPHKCPICDGSKKRYVDGVHYFNCESCDGKGIVWG